MGDVMRRTLRLLAAHQLTTPATGVSCSRAPWTSTQRSTGKIPPARAWCLDCDDCHPGSPPERNRQPVDTPWSLAVWSDVSMATRASG